MEFDNNNNQSVSDEQRRLAETKKLTLQPVHTDIAPEATPDTEIAARHLIDPALGNTTNDIEQDAAKIQPSKALLSEVVEQDQPKARFSVKAFVVSLLGVGLVGTALFFIFV